MSYLRTASLRRSRMLLGVMAACLAGGGASAAITILGTQYQPDQLYPEYKCLWHDDCHADFPGGNVHVYLKNTGASAVTITDVTLAGYSLQTVLKRDSTVHDANSIYFYWDEPPQAILAAGEPVWYKGDPAVIPPGGVAQAVVRLRFVPTTPTVTVGVVTSDGTVAADITPDANAPQLASVGFSPDRTSVYLHWRRSGGAAPATIKMDGVDVTSRTATVGDPSVNFAESVIQLASPLEYMSYHVFQGVYADGKTATASLRAWSHPFLYASWGTFPGAEDGVAGAQAWIEEATQHGFNAAQNQMIGGALGSYLGSSAGQAYAEALGGYGVIVWNKAQNDHPLLSFLDDEPDAEEANMANIKCGTGLKLVCGKSPMGILALREIEEGETYRALYPLTPTTINMDGAFRPVNYISWGQATDVLQVDPYYQKRLVDAYWWDATQIPLFRKATYIYAVTKATVTGAEPNPAHPILYSCEWRDTVDGVTKTWPFATTEAKRIEVYYSLAAGAKGISYWWFKPGYPSNGLGDQSKPAAQALWKELGLLGNEIKTAGPLLVTSHPVDMPITPGTNVWARSLASGTNTIILLVVNDDYYSDEAGCHYTPVGNATLTATLPMWMRSSPAAFEISAAGLSDVNAALNGSQLQLNLGTLKLTRMIVLTTDPQLRGTIQQRYDQQVRPGICAIAPELCAKTPPTIAQPPASQYAAPAGMLSFTVVASGTAPLSCQWQKNTAKLNNGGHYTGCTTATLTVNGVDTGDVASYRCVVTNSFGSVTSSPARLILGSPCNAPRLLNAGFEGTSAPAGIGTNWVGYQRAPNPTTVWSIQTASPPAGGGVQYQQIANTSGTGGGGVRQDITGCTVGATYQISGWMRGNSASFSTCTVKVSPSASPNWSTALDLNPPQTYTGANWTAFSGTVVATGTSMTLWLDGQTGGSGQNKAECFDAVTVTCLAAPPPLRFESAGLLPPSQVRLVLSGEPGKSVTVRQSSNGVDWVVLASQVNSNGIVQFTDVLTSNAVPQFYRATMP